MNFVISHNIIEMNEWIQMVFSNTQDNSVCGSRCCMVHFFDYFYILVYDLNYSFHRIYCHTRIFYRFRGACIRVSLKLFIKSWKFAFYIIMRWIEKINTDCIPFSVATVHISEKIMNWRIMVRFVKLNPQF